MARTVARRYTHQQPDQDLLSIAVAGVANWLSNQRLDLYWFISGADTGAAVIGGQR